MGQAYWGVSHLLFYVSLLSRETLFWHNSYWRHLASVSGSVHVCLQNVFKNPYSEIFSDIQGFFLMAFPFKN